MSARLKQLQQKEKMLSNEITELSKKVKDFQSSLDKLHKEQLIKDIKEKEELLKSIEEEDNV